MSGNDPNVTVVAPSRLIVVSNREGTGAARAEGRLATPKYILGRNSADIDTFHVHLHCNYFYI